jgi:hypothetical protein
LVDGQLAPVNERDTSCEWQYDVEKGLLVAGETESWWSLVLRSLTLEEAASNYTLAQEWTIVGRRRRLFRVLFLLNASDVTLLISGQQNLLVFKPTIQSTSTLRFYPDAVPFKFSR